MPFWINTSSAMFVDEEGAIESPLKSPDLWLRKPVTHLVEANDEQGKNSDYNGPEIDLGDMKEWKDFVTAKDIRSQLNATTLKALERAFTQKQLNKLTWDDPESGLNINEQSFERAWASVIHGINLVLRIVAEEEQGETSSEYIIIGDGDVAKRKAPKYDGIDRNIKRKKVDYASHEHISPERYNDVGPCAIYNRIPGDAKIYRKIRYSMFPPNGEEYIQGSRELKDEARKVLKQIYNYMDQHEARYGYVVNNQEIVFFRREPNYWGRMHISPPIRHDIEADLENGRLNSKYILFYFLHVIARDEKKWRLRSCLPMLPRKRLAPRKNGNYTSKKIKRT